MEQATESLPIGLDPAGDTGEAGPASRQTVGRLGRHSLVYAVSSLVGQMGSLLTFPLYTRALGPASYGVLAVGLAAAGVLRTLVIAGTNTTLMNETIGADEVTAREATGGAVAWILAASAVLAVIWVLIGRRIAVVARLGSVGFALGWAVLAYVSADSLLELCFSIARARSRPRLYALANSIRVGVTVVVAAVFLLGLHFGAEGAVMAMGVASACAGAWLAWRLRIRLSLAHVTARAVRLLRTGLPLVPANLGSWVTDLADRYLLLFLTGSAATVGLYSAGYRIGGLITVLFVQPFHTAYLPFMLEHGRGDAGSRLYAESSRLFVGFGSVAVLLLQATASPLIRVLAGSRYADSAAIVSTVALGCLLGGAAMLMTPTALKTGRVGALAAAFGLGALLNVVLNLALIPHFGMIGAAVATLAAYSVTLGGMAVFMPADARPAGLEAALVRAVPVCLAVVVASFVTPAGMTGVIIRGASAVAGVGVLFLTGALRIQDVLLIASAFTGLATREAAA